MLQPEAVLSLKFHSSTWISVFAKNFGRYKELALAGPRISPAKRGGGKRTANMREAVDGIV